MDLFTTADLQKLIDVPSSPCVSIYIPTHRTGREIRDDALHCKNALREAETALREQSVRPGDVDDILEPVRALRGDGEFWKRQSDGLAMFSAQDFFRSYRVPLSFEPIVRVNERYYVKPILPLLQGDGQFYLLALSQNQVRLFRGSKFSISPLEPARLPRSMQDALKIDEYIQSLQFFAYRPAGTPDAGQGDVMFHGQGGAGGEVQKRDEIKRFMQRVASGLEDLLAAEPRPLVFAGVDYLLPILRECLDDRHLLPTAVAGNPDELSAAQLHAEAWKLVSEEFQRERQRKLEQYGGKAGTGLATSQIETLVDAARQGAVDTLFLSEGAQAWGDLDEASQEIAQHDQPQKGDHDLLDLAAAQTIVNGGTVYTLDRGDMPATADAAALLRHPVAPVLTRANR